MASPKTAGVPVVPLADHHQLLRGYPLLKTFIGWLYARIPHLALPFVYDIAASASQTHCRLARSQVSKRNVPFPQSRLNFLDMRSNHGSASRATDIPAPVTGLGLLPPGIQVLLAAMVFPAMVLVASCGLETSSVTTAPAEVSTDRTPQDVLTKVKSGVAELRRLEFLEPVQVEYLGPAELTDYLHGLMGEKEREELRQMDELLSIIGLIEPDVDLVQLYLDLLSEGVLGAYDTRDGRLVVRLEGDTIGSDHELTLAHELTHALQQQHFDIHSLLEEAGNDFDRGLAISALAEGDATLLELLYLRKNSLPVPRVPDTPVYDSAPTFIQNLLVFPYTAGLRFLAQNFGEEDWTVIDAAYVRPPESTEQVMHPNKYLEGESPIDVSLPNVQDILGEGWSPIYSSVGGEFLIRDYLDSRLSTGDAHQAAAGWGGDAFALYEAPGDIRLLLWVFRWDSTDDAEEFFNGYAKLTEDEGGWVESIGNGDTRIWGRQGRWVHLQRAADHVSLIISPSEMLPAKLAPRLQQP